MHLFMEDGAMICCDEDLMIEEIVNGKLLIVAREFEEYNLYIKMANDDVDKGKNCQAGKLYDMFKTLVYIYYNTVCIFKSKNVFNIFSQLI